jgi:hypothetical protein
VAARLIASAIKAEPIVYWHWIRHWIYLALGLVLVSELGGPAGAATNTFFFNYTNRSHLLGDGWSFVATTPVGGSRDTEQNSGTVVSYDQTLHPGVLRVPVDVGDLWGGLNNTRNSLFRQISTNWVRLHLQMAFAPTLDLQQAHLGLYQDDDNYLSVVWSYNNGSRRVALINETGGSASPWSPREYGLNVPSYTNIHLRLERDLGTDFVIASYSTNGINWTAVRTNSQALINPRLGIWAGGSLSGFPNCDLVRLDVVTSDTPLRPLLYAQPRRLVFNAVQGEPRTNRQQIQVVLRRSQDSRSWNVGTNASWLSTSVSSGVTPNAQNPAAGVLDVFVNSTGLSVGTYVGQLNFTGSGLVADQTEVVLIVNPNNRVRTSRWGGGYSGVMTASTDDSYDSGSGQLLANNMRGTFYLWGLSEFPAWAPGLRTAGMELGTHTISHPCFYINEPALRYELEACINLVANGAGVPAREIISHCWPCGFTHPRARSIAADYFLSARGYNHNQFEEATPHDFMNLKSFNSHEHTPFPPADLKTLVDGAVTQRKWFNLVLHAFNNDDGAIASGAGKDLWVRPVGEVVKYIVQRDRTIITNYSASPTQIRYDAFRLPMPTALFRNFEANLTASDQVTFEVDVTGHPSVGGLTVESVATPYLIRDVDARRVLYFSTTLTTNFGNRTVQLTLSNATPVAVSQWVNLNEDASVPIAVVGTTRTGNSVSYTLLNAPTNGGLSGTLPNVTYTPAAKFHGGDLFRFRVTDTTSNLRATGQVSIAVAPVNYAPVLPAQSPRTIQVFDSLTVTNAATDVDVPADILTYSLLAAPAGALISSNGIITWSPTGDFAATTNTFTTRVVDNGTPPLSATNSFQVIVEGVGNTSPVLPAQTNRSMLEMTAVTVTNTATDADGTNTLTYSLLNSPPGAQIDLNGVITWLPTEAQGPGSYTLTTKVTDDGEPPLSATNSFQIAVLEVNEAPGLPVQTNHLIDEFTLLTVINTATDIDLPANNLTYQFLTAPVGANISPGGVITWTPGEEFGGTTNVITIRVVDNGNPVLSATNFFAVAVLEVNEAPVLPVQSDRFTGELTWLTVTNTAVDSDLPANNLSYSLLAAPPGVNLDTNGVITWLPGSEYLNTTNLITTRVLDDGVPPLSATNSFYVVVLDVNEIPVFGATPGNVVMAELATLIVTNAATDPDIPANALFYQLIGAPAGAQINSAGVITWTPTEAQGPSSNALVTVVTDNGVPAASVTNSFQVVVTEVNQSPAFVGSPPDLIVPELNLLTVTNQVTDADLPANQLNYQLLAAPLGAQINSQGVITWMPTEAQGPSTNLIRTVVSDGIVSVTNSFQVIVLDVNTAPVFLAAPPNLTRPELTLLAVTNTASDSDVPVNVLSYQLVNAPPGALIDLNGRITWTPSEEQGPGTNRFTTVVSDGLVSVTNSFDVTVTEVNVAPVFVAQPPDLIVAELAALLVTNRATDADIPVNQLTYQLAVAPVGATVNGAGVISWSPTIYQGGSTNRFATVVSDGAASATNEFLVVVEDTYKVVVTNVTWISAGAIWKYRDIGVDQGTGWRANDFNDAAWSSGPAQLGYGDGDEQTVVSYGLLSTLKHPTTYFRHAFNVGGRTNLTALTLRVLRDDGVVVYLNGAEVFRDNLPAGTITYSTLASSAINGNAENVFLNANLAPALLPGTNVVAVEMHQNALNSSDLSFDLELTAQLIAIAPVLPVQPDRIITELTALTVTNTAVDLDTAPEWLVYQLLAAPTGAEIDSNGVINWTPAVTPQGSTNHFITTVSDGTSSATNEFWVVVVNPHSQGVTNVTLISTGAVWKYLDLGVDPGPTWRENGFDDSSWSSGPAQLGYGDGDEQTVVSFGPNSSQKYPTTYFRTAFNARGRTNALAVHLRVLRDDGVVVYLNGLELFRDNLPAGTISNGTYAVAAIADDEEGILLSVSFPGMTLLPGTNVVAVEMHQNSPTSSDLSFNLELKAELMASAPELSAQQDRTIAELTLLTVTNTATDMDTPNQWLDYQLLAAPAGMQIDSQGIISWIPTETQGPGTNLITTVVSDGLASATNTFQVIVSEVNAAPVLPAVLNLTVDEAVLMVVTNAATDQDWPANLLSYELIAAPAGAVVDGMGLVSWTPSNTHGPSTNRIATVVRDNGLPPLSTTNHFDVIVRDSVVLPFAIQSIIRVNGEIQLTWEATPGRQYRLQYKDSLTEPEWLDLGAVIQAQANVVTITNVSAVGPFRFYRVQLLP